MNIQDLKPAKDFARHFGAKCIIYGGPGSAKTPLINTCPRPVLLACEPGMLSMRGSNVPTWEAHTAERIDEFFKWFFGSAETKNFDTLAIDSASEMCEIYLAKAKKENKHGLAAYGQMADDVIKHVQGVFYTMYKHTYIISKQEIISNMNVPYKRPYYPGKYLPVEMPHKYDFILHLGIHNVPGMGQLRSFQCHESIDTMARNRTGNLNEYEEPDFGKLVQKVMQ